ncbi:hypothetical protein, partial [Anaerovibrio sp.]|uniref:hypothetical protein n=1 Tax=Anaerovibrio sp. TaxID=1872532 RepID=UPI0025BEA13F
MTVVCRLAIDSQSLHIWTNSFNQHALDEDERIIDYLNDFRDKHLIYTKQLDAGTYYLKAKRA